MLQFLNSSLLDSPEVSEPFATTTPVSIRAIRPIRGQNVFQIKGYIRNLRIIDRLPMLEGYSERRGYMRFAERPDRDRIGQWPQEGEGLQVGGESPFVPWALRSSPCISAKGWRLFSRDRRGTRLKASPTNPLPPHVIPQPDATLPQ